MMLRLLCLALCLALSSAAEPQLFENDDVSLMQDEARFLYFNSSSTATSLTLLGAIILLGVIFYLVYVGGLLAPVAGSQSAFNRYGQDYGQYQGQYQARSAEDGWNFNAFSILQWINMATEMYENFEYDNLECQKRMICDVMTERETFGDVSGRMERGFELAKYLEILNLPDELRELLDEYMDASEKARAQKSCTDFFPCPYSLGQSIKKNLSGNSL